MSDVMRITVDGESGGPDLLYEALETAVGSESVHVIDIAEEFPETLPE